MRKFMIAGGGVGFLLGLISGLAQGALWPSVLWRSSLAALAAGLLLRWWGGIWLRSCYQISEAAADGRPNPSAAKPVPALPGGK